MNLEAVLAALLFYGTWLASLAIAVGLAAAWVGGPYGVAPNFPVSLVTGGIGLLILLPILRVALMLFYLLRRHDYRLAVAAILVLTIILAAAVIGLHTTRGPAA